MGKVWKRDGPNSQGTTDKVQQQKLHGKTNVWKRGQIAQPATPSESDAPLAAGSSSSIEQPVVAHEHSLGPAAKRRRLAAQGRLAQHSTVQNGSSSHRDAAEGLRAGGHCQRTDNSGSGAQPSEAEKREQGLRKEAEVLRRQIAEEEEKLSAAQVRFFLHNDVLAWAPNFHPPRI